MSTTDTLSRVKLFKGLSAHELGLLESSLSRRELENGAYLFKENDTAHSCFVILSGAISVHLKSTDEDSEPVAILETGETVGHLALVDRSKRSAACRVHGTTATLGELRIDDFERLFNAKTPFAYKILDNLVCDLVTRLRSTNQTLLRASLNRKSSLDKGTKRKVASQLLGRSMGVDDWDPDKVEVMGMSLEHRMRNRD